MKKIISFSLWGQQPRYLTGAIRNADIAEQIYPGWICRFYISQDTPSPVITSLKTRKNVEIIYMPYVGDWRSLYWRFLAIDDKDVSVMIVRDCDSRLGEREKAAVDEWLISGKSLHILRDHPWHRFPILGGMWGIKKGGLQKSMKQFIQEFNVQNKYGSDYEFLGNIILPLFKNNDDYLCHDEFFDGKEFPIQRVGLEFVGKVYEADETTILEHEQILEQHLRGKGKI